MVEISLKRKLDFNFFSALILGKNIMHDYVTPPLCSVEWED
jgi:hypothetical protein